MGRAADDPWARLPLRDRMPEYLALFGLGLVVGLTVGWVVGLIFSVPMAKAIGYTFFALGLFLLLGGGAAGGEYKALGLGQGAGRVKHIIDEDPHVLQDLRSARRPGRNPAAFWMVVAGAIYTGLGLVVVSLA
jgi:hypothetical protein